MTFQQINNLRPAGRLCDQKLDCADSMEKKWRIQSVLNPSQYEHQHF